MITGFDLPTANSSSSPSQHRRMSAVIHLPLLRLLDGRSVIEKFGILELRACKLGLFKHACRF